MSSATPEDFVPSWDRRFEDVPSTKVLVEGEKSWAKYCALELHRKLPQKFPLPEIIGLLEMDWCEKLQEWRQTLGREFWCLRRPVAVFFDDRFIGSDIELIKLTTIGNILMENIPRKDMAFIKEHFRKDYISYLRKTKRIYCYLDICIDDVYVGTLTFQLYSDLLPRTCENFKTLCMGIRGPLLSYRNTQIHRIVKQGWLQGGDVQFKTGGGGLSIFCDPLEDECFGISHDRRGVLSMANAGRHKNGSQFFITLKPSQWMDTHYVAFGQLIEGAGVLKILENLETFYECPLQKVEIKSCGKLDLGDVEDIGVISEEETIPLKKRKKIETISEQVVRLVIEALTDALARKEHSPDILDNGDVPSKMNLQLYFQGFYSLPESILEKSAAYLRKLRRELLRTVKPSATEIVEVLLCDLLMAVMTRMTTLDDVRETIGHDLYQKMVSGIDMKLEMCRKSYVKRLVDQIVSTAESMVNLVSKKIINMKRKSENLQRFQDRMQEWVQSFVLQETFQDDNYFIADRPFHPPEPLTVKEKKHPKREGKPCCEMEKMKKEVELKAKLRAKYAPEDLCCLGSKLHLSDSEINLYDYFSTCTYDLKRVLKRENHRMPLLDMIEISRFKLRWLRKKKNLVKSEERLCVEKKIQKWMSEVAYIPETSWLKDVVFPKDCLVLDHLEEIMYGAMTAGLLEMYYFMEEYLKLCGGKKKIITRTIYPEDSDTQMPEQPFHSDGPTNHPVSHSGEPQEHPVSRSSEPKKQSAYRSDESKEHPPSRSGEPSEVDYSGEETKVEDEKKLRPPCTCGHPCCVCEFDPNYRPLSAPPPSLEEEEEGGGKGREEFGELSQSSTIISEQSSATVVQPPSVKPCASDETLVDLNAVLAEKVSVSPEEIDIRSFRWLKPYILAKGCDLKTEFATQVHKWLEGERFSYRGFISKHSLVSRASLLSLSFSLAELIREENNLKSGIKNFVYDLWNLYFEEMFKEALLEFPPDVEEKLEDKGEFGGEEELKNEYERGLDICGKLKGKSTDFDFEKLCEQFNHEIKEKVVDTSLKDSGEEEKKNFKKPEEETQEIKTESKTEVQKPVTPLTPTISPTPSHSLLSARQDDFSVESEFQIVHTETQEVKKEMEVPKATKDEVSKAGGGDGDDEKPKKRKSPIVIEELVDESSSDESRTMPPYKLPFWVRFLTELTKQALGSIAKVSRLPRRLYSQTDSEMAFDDKMKEWFEFNAFNPRPTKGREIMDFIALHHKSRTDLEDTARSYLKKKKYSEVLNRCTRFSSAEDLAEEIVTDVIDNAMSKTTGEETLELFVSSMLASAVTSTAKSQESMLDDEEENDYNTFDTDRRESDLQEDEENEL